MVKQTVAMLSLSNLYQESIFLETRLILCNILWKGIYHGFRSIAIWTWLNCSPLLTAHSSEMSFRVAQPQQRSIVVRTLYLLMDLRFI